MAPLPIPRERCKQRGVAFLALATVVATFGALKLTTDAVQELAADGAGERTTTTTRLDAAEAALVRYTAANGRLPCPANGEKGFRTKKGSAEQRSGGTCDIGADKGVLPWRTLGMSPEDALDGHERRISYVPYTGDSNTGSLAADNGMAFVRCLKAITDSSVTCPHNSASPTAEDVNKFIAADSGTSGGSDTIDGLFRKPYDINLSNLSNAERGKFIDYLRDEIMVDQGITVNDGNGNTLMNPGDPGAGAAFALVVHGRNGCGAWTADGGRVSKPGSADPGDHEATNADDPDTVVRADHSLNDKPETCWIKGNFDDRVIAKPVSIFAQRIARWGAFPANFITDINAEACAGVPPGSSKRSPTSERRALCKPSGGP